MILELIIHIFEFILFAYLGLSAVYVFVFSLAGLFRHRPFDNNSSEYPRIAVLIPGYKEDQVIIEVASDALNQDYPKENFDVVIIADQFKAETIESLQQLPIKVIEVNFENSTKSKSLNAAMKAIGDDYDLALILDADNLMSRDFLKKISKSFDTNIKAVQGHRVAKNLNTSLAILDAISEEINNHIFRKGHRVLGLSSALIGSGMAFEYPYFKRLMKEINAIGGFDKELELRMLQEGIKIEYVHEALVLDEKVQKKEVFAKQRTRWLSAQFYYFTRFISAGIQDLFKKGNVDFFDKVVQMILPPRVLLIGLLTIITLIAGILALVDYIWFWQTFIFSFSNWLGIWLLTFLGLLMAVPLKFYNQSTVKALASLPGSFMIIFLSVFRLKGANKTFIHTQHGIVDEKSQSGNVENNQSNT